MASEHNNKNKQKLGRLLTACCICRFVQDEMLARFVTDSHIRHHPGNEEEGETNLPVSIIISA